MWSRYRPVMTDTTSSTSTTATTDRLGLRGVLASSLPASLGTPSAPSRYSVEAIFTRRPERAEVEAILSAPTTAFLVMSGYPDARLTVTDRRLEIGNTNLDELSGGLAAVIADLLLDVSDRVVVDRNARADLVRQHAAEQLERSERIAREAEAIQFVPTR